MLYNKNNVRKTNDKKILHKVGKQWKVVSVALLMAIGGGAAVATHANAQQTANNNYDNNAEAQEIAGNDSIGNNAVTPKSASSASAKPAKPASAVSYLSGYNGSAASYHAKAQTDEASYQANSAVVKTYVNSLNNEFPKQTSSLNSTLNSATDQTNADQSSENSYSAIAAQSNYSSQVSSLAAKANMTSSAYIESVGAQASNFNSEISANSVLASQMSTVTSYAQLISNINDNSALSTAYVFKSQSASNSASIANAYLNNAKNSLTNALNLSANNENSLIADQASYNTVATEEAIAIANGSSDNAFVQSIANVNANANYANSSSVSNVVSAMASATNATRANNNGAFVLKSNTTTIANNDTKAANHLRATSYVTGTSANGNSTIYTYWTVSSVANRNNVPHVDAVRNGVEFDATTKSGATFVEPYNTPAFVQDVSDTAAQLRYSAENVSLSAAISNEKANVSKYSDGVDAASAAAQSAQNSYDNASDEASAMAELVGNPTLANLFAVAAPANNTNKDNQNNHKATITPEQVKNAESNLFNGTNVNVNKLNNNSINTLLNNPLVAPSVKTDLTKLTGNKLQDHVNTITGALHAAAKAALENGRGNLSLSDLAKKAVQNDQNANDQMALNALSAFAKDNPSLTLSDVQSAVNKAVQNPGLIENALNANKGQKPHKHQLDAAPQVTLKGANHARKATAQSGILNASSYETAYQSLNADGLLTNNRATMSHDVSAIGSIANNANAGYTSASSASVSYSAATDESVALASSYATSYSADVNADKTVQSVAQNSLDNFYATHADTKYATASSNAASLSAAVPSDNAYAEGNGLHVFNYGPKFIIVTKAGQLHTQPDYNTKDDKVVGKVPAGAQLAVKSVYFGQNGVTRYEVNYDGTTGLFTANPAFSKQAYLPAYSGVDVTVNKNARVYKSADFKKAIGSIKAGKTVKDVNVVTMDHKRNGFTRIETQDGKWFTANTNYVSLNGTSANNTNSAEAQQLNKSNNPVNFWN